MTKCLWCAGEVNFDISWTTILNPPSDALLCKLCKSQLVYIEGEVCLTCNRLSTLDVCYDCEQWQRFYDGNDPLLQNISVFQYNVFLQDIIAKWKYRGDYILGNLFRKAIQEKYIQQMKSIMPKDTVILPIPLSTERMQERAFNQAEQLAEFIPETKISSMIRKHGEKQSKKSRLSRMYAKNPFNLEKKVHNAVVLVDDIYTTGSTLRQAAKLLQDAGSPAVYALTLARG